MKSGHIDAFGRAMLSITMRPEPEDPDHELQVWIDTGFTGDLVLPESLIRQFGLPESAMVMAALADGSQSVVERYSCVVEWFGESRGVEVIASSGQTPLLGVGLLLGRRLLADYDRLTVSVE